MSVKVWEIEDGCAAVNILEFVEHLGSMRLGDSAAPVINVQDSLEQ